MEVDQKKTGGDMKVECKLRSGGDMPTPRRNEQEGETASSILIRIQIDS